MNYTCLIYGGVLCFAILWFAIDARKWFTGPKINVEHMIHGGNAEVIEGKVLKQHDPPEGSEHTTKDSEKT